MEETAGHLIEGNGGAADDQSVGGVGDGADNHGGGTPVLEWLMSEEATAVARRALARCGFGTEPSLVEDVVSDAQVALLTRMRSTTPLSPENPAAYGTVVVRNVVNRLTRGDVIHLEDLDDHEAPSQVPVGDESADELRLLLERRQAPAWLTSAALAYLCFLMEPEDVPASAPAPRSGAREDQALVWPALWFAGERHLFPDSSGGGDRDPCKRTRARRIKAVLDHVGEAFSLYRSERGHRRG